jgi:hypothetical protein
MVPGFRFSQEMTTMIRLFSYEPCMLAGPSLFGHFYSRKRITDRLQIRKMQHMEPLNFERFPEERGKTL